MKPSSSEAVFPFTSGGFQQDPPRPEAGFEQVAPFLEENARGNPGSAFGRHNPHSAHARELGSGLMRDSVAHSRQQRALNILVLVVLLALLMFPFPWLRKSSFHGSLDLHATTEMIGAVFGLFTGLAFVVGFHALGNRFHLFIGLAYFVGGMEDLVHGMFSLRDFFGLVADDLQHFLPQTYVTGQLLIGLTLLLALILPSWLGRRENLLRDTVAVSLLVLAMTTVIAALLDIPWPGWAGGNNRFARPADLLSSGILLLTLLAYVGRYLWRGEMLVWWIALSLATNLAGQIMMLFYVRLFDAFFDIAHLYKVLGYLAPLLGLFLYQVWVVVDYRHAQEELINAREAALAAVRARSAFLANLSHEVRTPMNGVLGMTERALATSLSPVQREYLLAVRASAQSLLTLLNDILDFSKIESGKFKLHPAPFALRPCLQQTLAPFRVAARDKELHFVEQIDPEVPDWLHGDAGRLRQILVNLLGNAIKFTEQGEVGFRVTALTPSSLAGDREPSSRCPLSLCFVVRDSGIGISADKQQHIFDAFSQADGSTTRRYGGTGLGLAICKELVALMGGELALESMPDRGSTFTVTLPFRVAIPPTVAVSSSDYLLPKLTGLRVLVVEDNDINQAVVRGLLTDADCQVTCADNGPTAFQVVQVEAFDAILMDLQMPDWSGEETTACIRQWEAQQQAHGLSRPRLPIIALTAHALPGDRERCLQAGIDDFLTKPLEPTLVLQTLQRHTAALRDWSPQCVHPPNRWHSERDALALPEQTQSESVDSLAPREPLFQEEQAAPDQPSESRELLPTWEEVGGLLAHFGDATLVRDLLEAFAEQQPSQQQELHEALSCADLPKLARVAHHLAGSLGSLRFALAEAARQVETAARREELAAAMSLGEQLGEELTRLARQVTHALVEDERLALPK